MGRAICLLTLLVVLTACSSDPEGRGALLSDTLTRRQRDSLLAESKLPGAKAIKKALDVSDSAAARLVPVDSLIRQ